MRHNTITLYGRVTTEGVRCAKDEDGNFAFALFKLDTVRSKRRTIEDLSAGTMHEHILVLTRDKKLAEMASEYVPNDIIYLKGTINTKKMPKTETCPFCGKSNKTGVGNVLFVTPIFMEYIRSCDNAKEAITEISKRDEISNSVTIIGTLIRDPKIFKTKKGLQVTQYPIAIDRKYMIKQDDPSIRTDWPFVKSYGEQARNDKLYLHYQSDVFIDGFLQKRGVQRHAVCPFCGKAYDWRDDSMEIVPYSNAIEYLNNFWSKEEIEEMQHKSFDEIMQTLYNGLNDTLDDETNTMDLKEDEDDDTTTSNS